MSSTEFIQHDKAAETSASTTLEARTEFSAGQEQPGAAGWCYAEENYKGTQWELWLYQYTRVEPRTLSAIVSWGYDCLFTR